VEQRTASAAGDAVDLDRYPIAHLGAPRARELIERCRGQLRSEGLCVLHGFLRPEAVERAVEQARSGLAGAHAKERAICAYDDEDIDPGLPAGDPVRKLHRHSMRVIAYDRLGADSPVRRLYEWDGLTAFLSEVLEEPVHTCADPLLSVVVTAMGDGQEQGWHFDDNDYVVSLLLQRAERGGEFEYAPMIRDGADQAYDRVRAVFAGAGDEVRVVPADAGTLALFRGRRSVHRVSPVSGDRDRLIALLSFDSRPGMMFPAEVQRNNVGRTAG